MNNEHPQPWNQRDLEAFGYGLARGMRSATPWWVYVVPVVVLVAVAALALTLVVRGGGSATDERDRRDQIQRDACSQRAAQQGSDTSRC